MHICVCVYIYVSVCFDLHIFCHVQLCGKVKKYVHVLETTAIQLPACQSKPTGRRSRLIPQQCLSQSQGHNMNVC